MRKNKIYIIKLLSNILYYIGKLIVWNDVIIVFSNENIKNILFGFWMKFVWIFISDVFLVKYLCLYKYFVILLEIGYYYYLMFILIFKLDVYFKKK